MKKIQIIGGGLAGLALGVCLRNLGVDVILLEAGKYPKHKVCGEFICGVSPKMLSDLGIREVVEQSLVHETMQWWMGDSKVLEDALPTPAWGLSRYKLDYDLSQLFHGMGGELVTGSRADLKDEEAVVWATGKPKKRGGWIGLKIHALNAEVDGLEMHVGDRGYIGLCGIEGERVNCCGLFRVDKSIKATGGQLIAEYLRANGLNQLADRFSEWTKDEDSFSATAGFSFGKQVHAGGFCVGDASYLIPPFTGNGMSMALESAWMAGKWLEQYAKNEIDWTSAIAGYDNECVAFFLKRMKLSATVQPLMFHRLGRTLLKTAAKTGVLPFEFLFHQLRTP
ncbi:FAD-dependent oxidoreductase [Oceaniferula spumae]|uniref:FAD-dependent oxidoreductase n=1 Tax=Oceaniferula spumae TaxID=2979115 RepID=A0AAT9FGU1_9BACT